ncbi:MAG: hypothetical protein EPO00_08700 [Chloroflexota bacterium]|nr:MAG: hypothetical protein EPO00_08700 [Chloroflexota bacterium]
MSRLHWILRRELLLADLLLIGTIVGLLLTRAIEGPGHLGGRPFALVPIAYLVLAMHLIAFFSEPGVPRDRWLFIQLAKRLSDLAIGVVIFLLVMPQHASGPMFDPGSGPSIFGIPAATVVLALGVVGLVGGWIWIRLIAHGEPVPEANDRFWRSRH